LATPTATTLNGLRSKKSLKLPAAPSLCPREQDHPE
jgi:hypothetical protein